LSGGKTCPEDKFSTVFAAFDTNKNEKEEKGTSGSFDWLKAVCHIPLQKAFFKTAMYGDQFGGRVTAGFEQRTPEISHRKIIGKKKYGEPELGGNGGTGQNQLRDFEDLEGRVGNAPNT